MTREDQLDCSIFFFVCLVDMFCLGLVFALFSPLFISSSFLFSEGISLVKRFEYLGFAFAITPLFQLIGSFIFGLAADRFSPKRVLCFSMMGYSLGFGVLVLAIFFHSWPGVIFSRACSGFFSGYIAVLQAMMANRVTGTKVARFNILEIGLGLGMLLGPWFGNRLLVAYPQNFVNPFLFAWILTVVSWFFVAFFLKSQNVVTVKRGVVRPFLRLPFLANKLLLVFAVFMLGWSAYFRFFPTFLERGLGLDSKAMASVYLFMGLIYFGVQVFIVLPFSSKLLPRRWLFPSIIGVALAIVGIALSEKPVQFYGFMVLYMLSMAVFLPVFHARLSDATPVAQQGEVFGLSVSVHALMSVLAGLFGGLMLVISAKVTLFFASVLILLSALLLAL